VVVASAQAGASTTHVLGRTKSSFEKTKQLMEQQHSRASVFGHVADIIDEAGVKQPANRVRAWDVIVASAGHISVPKALENSNTEEWWRSFEVTKPSVLCKYSRR
jgi:NADP-dependent 3-hydroxy acid dehydrogenase YdfG